MGHTSTGTSRSGSTIVFEGRARCARPRPSSPGNTCKIRSAPELSAGHDRAIVFINRRPSSGVYPCPILPCLPIPWPL
jgi:hypothetical protein